MQSTRFLRVVAGAATRIRATTSCVSTHHNVEFVSRRSSCASNAATPKSYPNLQSKASEMAKPVEAKPVVEAVETIKSATVAESSALGEAERKAGESVTAKVATENAGGKLPDVPSTSLGFEDPDANDPLKWKKFAYKYAGAVLLFMISYKSLHWYVDGLQKDGKRQREEVEENKEIIREINAPRESMPLVPSSAAPVAGPAVVANKAVENSAEASVTLQGDNEVAPMRIFDPVKDEEPNLVSELDELFVYKIELETKLRDLRMEKKTTEIDSQLQEVNTELKALATEIEMLEADKAKKAKS